ncbi:hypothetical protein [Caldisphaera sp.]|uniref:hypothetical protein n=1 Tax=Caldisphaera sp. TaxID=2060322 RepID=UPI0025B92323|nr:hypothetical protein [Caldisphaera sp.]
MERKSRYLITILAIGLILTNALWVVSYYQINNSLNKYKENLNQSLATLNNASKVINYYQTELNATKKLLNVTTTLLSLYNKTLIIEIAKDKLSLLNNSLTEYKIAKYSFSSAINLTLGAIQNQTGKYNLTLAKTYINITYLALNQILFNGNLMNLPSNFTSNITHAISLVNSVSNIINNLSNGGKPTVGDVTTLNNALILYNYYLLSSEYVMIKNIYK